jgi:hypothetical protein
MSIDSRRIADERQANDTHANMLLQQRLAQEMGSPLRAFNGIALLQQNV